MSSTAVHIADAWAGLQAGRLPGAFDAPGATFTLPRVSTVNSRGATLHWEVRVQVHDAAGQAVPFRRADWLAQPVPELPGLVGVVATDAWQEGGKLRAGGRPTLVRAGKNLGKKNATNAATQALRDALGLYNKQVRRAGVALVPPAGGPAPAAAEPAAEPAAEQAAGPAAEQAAGPASAAAAGPAACGAGRPAPMLVKKVGETAEARLTPAVFAQGVTVQRKYNGVRLVACLGPGEAGAGGPGAGVVLYSRTGGEYLGMNSLRSALGALLRAFPAVWAHFCAQWGRDPWLEVRARCGPAAAQARAPRLHIDGELYEHGKSLRWISGQSRSAAGGESLRMMVFDCFLPELVAAGVPVRSSFRQAALDALFAACDAPGVRDRLMRAENFPVAWGGPPGGAGPGAAAAAALALAQVEALAARFVADGYEGAIVRKDAGPYQYGTNGTHSAHLVKVKPRFDAEFPVVGYTQGARGKDLGALIWVCEVPAARSKTGAREEFSVVPKNTTYAERYELFRRLGLPHPGGGTYFDAMFRGQPLTVEYPELSSKTGIPTQAKALGFRVYEPTPEFPGGRPDPTAVLLALKL